MKMSEITTEDIRPVGAITLIETEEDTETSSGLELAESDHHPAPAIGRVLRRGDRSKYQEGTIIVFRQYSADKVEIVTAEERKQFFLVEDEEVIATVGQEEEEKDTRAQIKLRRGSI